MKKNQANERTINVPCNTPALKKIIPRKLACHLKYITVIGEESKTGAMYHVKVRMVFAALIAIFPKNTKGLLRLRDRTLKRKEHVNVTYKCCEELTPAFN